MAHAITHIYSSYAQTSWSFSNIFILCSLRRRNFYSLFSSVEFIRDTTLSTLYCYFYNYFSIYRIYASFRFDFSYSICWCSYAIFSFLGFIDGESWAGLACYVGFNLGGVFYFLFEFYVETLYIFTILYVSVSSIS